MGVADMATDIRTIAEECLKQLELLVSVHDTIGNDNSSKADDWGSTGLSTDDHLARFRMWAGNIGVFAEAHASLDHRLRYNEAAKLLMINFLRTLGDYLQRGKSLPEQKVFVLTSLSSSHRVDRTGPNASARQPGS